MAKNELFIVSFAINLLTIFFEGRPVRPALDLFPQKV